LANTGVSDPGYNSAGPAVAPYLSIRSAARTTRMIKKPKKEKDFVPGAWRLSRNDAVEVERIDPNALV